MNTDTLFDLYLYVIPRNDQLIKIPHLPMSDAKKYAEYWFEMNEMHDYMLVTEDSTPWTEPPPSIDVKTPEWIQSEFDALQRA